MIDTLQAAAAAPPQAEPPAAADHVWRAPHFSDLMARRVRSILLVASPYDSFIFEEDGLLSELLSSQYAELGGGNAPRVRRATTGGEAIDALYSEPFDMVITMLHVGDMDVFAFGKTAREIQPDSYLVLLISNELELNRLGERRGELQIDALYVWQGDARLFLTIINVLEDMWNADQDIVRGDVGVIILVEDSARYRSLLLTILYNELAKQMRSVMLDGLNAIHRHVRMRARPKIRVAETFEDALALFERYHDNLYGVVTDVSYHRGAKLSDRAGVDLIKRIRSESPDLPCLLQSSDLKNRALAESVKTHFIHKRSTHLEEDIEQFLLVNLGFGEFVFRLPDGTEVARAADLREMTRVLEEVPAESLEFHARRNHFSNWLRARTEFALARHLRPLRVRDFQDIEALRRYLIQEFIGAMRFNRRGVVEDYSREYFDETTRFARIGGGSIGGKARGLAFLDALLSREGLDVLEGVQIHVPRCVVLGTDIFDAFLEDNELRALAPQVLDDERVTRLFCEAALADGVMEDLRAFLRVEHRPLAVRSSGLLEDSRSYPFAGVYQTHMLDNRGESEDQRLEDLASAIKRVYASAFHRAARQYVEATGHRIEEQRMAVILQPIVGSLRENYYYPNFSGVLRSFNFYPFGQMKPEDGVASVALGLGQEIVEGGKALRFSPAHPQVLPQLTYGKQLLDSSQRFFYGIDMSGRENVSDVGVTKLDLDVAERHGTLELVGSVWSPENEALYDGIWRPGVRVVSFAHVLKSNEFPLAQILQRLMQIGANGMSSPVEIEFAVNITQESREFAVLQLRPFGAGGGYEPVSVKDLPRAQMLGHSSQALGNGVIAGIHDVVYIPPEKFNAANTRDIAAEITRVNEKLRAAKTPYLLIGFGRWGSADPWLGIPVVWSQISGARVIIEATLPGFAVDLSQGSHFFHNLTASGSAYLMVTTGAEDFIEWNWLAQQTALEETAWLRHVRLATPLEIRVDGRTSQAVILKHSNRAG